MDIYEKPVVLETEDLAEGVYAASGAVSGVSVSNVELVSEGNEYNKVNTYKVSIKNNESEASSDWSVFISITYGSVTEAKIYNNWLASASLSGSAIKITPGGGGTIPAGGSIDVEVVVLYNSDSVRVSK